MIGQEQMISPFAKGLSKPGNDCRWVLLKQIPPPHCIGPIRTAGAVIDRLITALKNRRGRAERAHHVAVFHALLIDGADILVVIESEFEHNAIAEFDITFGVSDLVENKATGGCAEGVGLIAQDLEYIAPICDRAAGWFTRIGFGCWRLLRCHTRGN